MGDTYNWYQQLARPSWAPPSWLFGPVWSVLYSIIGLTFGIVFFRIIAKQWPVTLALPFVLNLVFNVLFTPLQFGLRNNLLAAVDIVLVLITLVWLIARIYPYSKWIALAQVPYFLWVSFASVLQLTVTYLNR